MRTTIATLTLSYVLSQFYRAFLAVLAPVLAKDIGAGPEDLAAASGWWFLAFAAMQLPVGWALDRVGPRLTVSVLMAVAAVGAAVFASATGPGMIHLAMLLIGAGCAPVLMGAYFIFARTFSPKVFGSLAGMVIGVGSLGNIAASAPLTWAVASFGWRGAIGGLAAVTLATALLIGVLVRDPPRLPMRADGSIWDLLRLPALWPVLLMMAACYAPAAGLRGLWAGPYLTAVYSADAASVGRATLVMGLAMVAGNFAYGPADRLLGTRKWLNFGGNALMLACLVGLALMPSDSLWLSTALLAGVGFFGATFPMVMAHGRAFMPPALVGRGVTLMNLFGIGAAGLMQMATGRLHGALLPSDSVTNSAPPALPFVGIFWAYAALIALGLGIYLFSHDRTD